MSQNPNVIRESLLRLVVFVMGSALCAYAITHALAKQIFPEGLGYVVVGLFVFAIVTIAESVTLVRLLWRRWRKAEASE